MANPFGGGVPTSIPCTREEEERNSGHLQQTVVTVNEHNTTINEHDTTINDHDTRIADIETSIGTDAHQVLETSGGTAGYLDEKIDTIRVGGTYSGGTWQDVYAEIIGGKLFFFTDITTDDKKVKMETGDTAEFLKQKIHANSLADPDDYSASSHFLVNAGVVSSTDLRFYAPWNIIKVDSADASPGYLYPKFANPGTSGAGDRVVEFQNNGSTITAFMDISDLGTGATINEGYGIDVVTNDIHCDPTEFTGATADVFQLFANKETGLVNRADPAWETIADYDGTKDQMWWHRSGTFEFQSTASYDDTAGTFQFLGHLADTWDWYTVSGYDGTKHQLIWHEDGSWKALDVPQSGNYLFGSVDGTPEFKTIADWLNLLSGYVVGNDQSIGHAASGTTEWQDDCTS